MRAIYFEEFNGPLTVVDLPQPVAAPGSVVIKVAATGLCRSDWHGWVGHDADIPLPHVPGHEFAGVVDSVGSGVTRFSVGQRVTVPFVCGCGRCEYCLRGDAQVCPTQSQPGFTHWGSFAEYVEIHNADFNLIELPDAISFDTAAGLGCRFATAFRGLTSRAELQAGEWIAIFGCGGVGLSAIMIAKALGAKVIAVDINEAALAKARELGADFTIHSLISQPAAESKAALAAETTSQSTTVFVRNASNANAGAGKFPSPEEAIAMITGSQMGADISVDALGSVATATSAIKSLRRRGRHLQLGLLPSSDGQTPLPMGRVIGWELDLLGSHGMSAVDYPRMLRMIAEGFLKPDLLVERVISLEEGRVALDNLETSSSAGVTIIHPAE
jgi:alcohol dehydrogenase